MSLQEIHQYFRSPHPIYLGKEVATCYILCILIEEGDSYAKALMELIEANYSPHCVSDTVLYGALTFLTNEGFILSYWQNKPGKGRPRRMYSVKPEKLDEARRLAQLWHQFLGDDHESDPVNLS